MRRAPGAARVRLRLAAHGRGTSLSRCVSCVLSGRFVKRSSCCLPRSASELADAGQSSRRSTAARSDHSRRLFHHLFRGALVRASSPRRPLYGAPSTAPFAGDLFHRLTAARQGAVGNGTLEVALVWLPATGRRPRPDAYSPTGRHDWSPATPASHCPLLSCQEPVRLLSRPSHPGVRNLVAVVVVDTLRGVIARP